MCGRIKLLTFDEVRSVCDKVERELAQEKIEGWQDLLPEREDAYPNSKLYILRHDARSLVVEESRWGYPASWQAGPVFNTRIESALSGSGMWSDSIQNHRCIVPVAAFFERKGSSRIQYVFSNDAPMLLAGIYEGDHFSVVTTEPNADVAPIHPRMPLVLEYDEAVAWLGDGYATLSDRSALKLRSASEESLTQPSLF